MAIAEHYGYVRMNDLDAQIKVDGSKFARGLSKLLNVHIDTVLWLEEHQIPSEATRDIEQHHNDKVEHHGVQRTIDCILEERRLAKRYQERDSHRDSQEDRDSRKSRDSR